MRTRTALGAALIAATALIVGTSPAGAAGGAQSSREVHAAHGTQVAHGARYTGRANRPHPPSGWANLRLADLNTDFALSSRQFTRELGRLVRFKPDVLFLQETRSRDDVLSRWAHRHHYLLRWPANSAEQESVVLLRDNGRFRIKQVDYRLGTPATRTAAGWPVGARYIQTLRTIDHVSGRQLAFSSTHLDPQSWWWPEQRHQPGAPRPYLFQPRWGTATMDAAKRHIRAVRRQTGANRSAGYTSIIGADFNSPFALERHYRGFMTREFHRSLVSDQQRLGQLPTHTDLQGHHPRTIDYVYASNDWRLRFLHHRIVYVPSDHHGVIVDMGVRRTR